MLANIKPSTAQWTQLSSSLSSMDRAQWLALLTRQAPQVVSTLAVLGIAWQAADLTWLVLSPSQASNVVATATPVPSNSPAINPQSIADAHLFGTATVNTGPADPNTLPQNTSLVLAGTMALNDPEAGFAIVGENAASAKFYRVGATINGGARLHSVYQDRVIIERNGQLETLLLPHGPSTGVAATPVRSTPASTALARLANATPETLGNILRAQPVFANGVQKGYRVYPGRSRSQFTKLGLQAGDLVTAINGNTLDDPNRGAEILATLTSSTSAVVTVERNGAATQLNLDISQLSLTDGDETGSDQPGPGNSGGGNGGGAGNGSGGGFGGNAAGNGSNNSNSGPRGGGFNGPSGGRSRRGGTD